MGRKSIVTQEIQIHQKVKARPWHAENAESAAELSLIELRKGNEAACEALVRCYYSRVYNYLYHLCGHAEMAEDLCQETFLKAWKNISGFAGRSNLMTWLFAIARNTFIDEVRRNRLPTVSLDGRCMEVRDGSPHAGQTVGEEDRADYLRARIMELPEREKTALLLHYVERLSFRQLAKITGVPVGTAKYHVSRGLAMLRERVKEGEV